MSASAVRGGQVYVEIGANPSKLLNALRTVNTQVGQLGDAVAGVGARMAAGGSAVFAPIAAAGLAFASQTEEVARARASLKTLSSDIGSAVAPAVVGLANAITVAASAASQFVRDNPNLVRQIATIGALAVGAGTGLVLIGSAISSATSASSAFLKPIYDLGRLTALLVVNLGRLAIAAVITSAKMAMLTASTIAQATAQALASNGVAVFAAGIAGIAVAIAVSSVKLDDFNAALSVDLTGAAADAKAALAGMAESATTAMNGVFNAISAGDIPGAMQIAWAGAVAVWLKGQKTIMDAVDPFVSAIQNVFDYLGTNVVNNWDALGVGSAAVVRTLSAVIRGVFDDLANGVMATFDKMVGEVQKAWIRIKDVFSEATDTQQKLDAIDAENKKRADEREKMRPGIQKRLAEATVVNQLNEGALIARQQRNRELSDRRMAGREEANRQRSGDRAAAVAAAEAELRARVVGAPVPKPVQQITDVKRQIAGTFSSFGVDQMGAVDIARQQLNALLKIQAGIDEANRVGGIIA